MQINESLLTLPPGLCLVFGMGLALALPGSAARAEESHPGLMNEALYSEAVVAFHRKQLEQASDILNGLLATSPDYAEALELKALVLKTQGKEDEAIESYQKLLTVRPPEARAPYHYELGVLYYHQKKEDLAKSELELALRARFNATVCRFFLGMIDFSQNNNRHAEYYFHRVAREAPGELKLISLYYLGLIELRTSYPMGATRDLREARKLAAELPPSDTTKQLGASVDQLLAPFETSQWFANATVLGQYNSNISQLPTS